LRCGGRILFGAETATRVGGAAHGENDGLASLLAGCNVLTVEERLAGSSLGRRKGGAPNLGTVLEGGVLGESGAVVRCVGEVDLRRRQAVQESNRDNVNVGVCQSLLVSHLCLPSFTSRRRPGARTHSGSSALDAPGRLVRCPDQKSSDL
jgi:hypothetical protein